MKMLMVFFLKIKELFGRFFFSSAPSYRIVEINTAAQEVVFRVKNKAVLLKCKFSEAIADRAIIHGLSSADACWLGGYYGRALRASHEGRGALKKVKDMTFLLSGKRGRYVVAFQNRNGEIGYYNKRLHQEIVEHPLTLAANPGVISEFDPSQACYIGILAGLQFEKALASGKDRDQVDMLLKKPPKLRII